MFGVRITTSPRRFSTIRVFRFSLSGSTGYSTMGRPGMQNRVSQFFAGYDARDIAAAAISPELNYV
jgi:hypothetical protein